ncbi:MAG: hypothetical protein IJ731_09870 [Eubacterium sp.]|nr:hypothetical protein [Eubacterium sp.]
MTLVEYLAARASGDKDMAKEVEAYEKEQNERFQKLEEENENLRETIDTILTDVIPNLEV